MLTEEAHHLFVGDTGMQRVIERTAELTRKHGEDGVRAHGGPWPCPNPRCAGPSYRWLSKSFRPTTASDGRHTAM
jgi:hypothetical protein